MFLVIVSASGLGCDPELDPESTLGFVLELMEKTLLSLFWDDSNRWEMWAPSS